MTSPTTDSRAEGAAELHARRVPVATAQAEWHAFLDAHPRIRRLCAPRLDEVRAAGDELLRELDLWPDYFRDRGAGLTFTGLVERASRFADAYTNDPICQEVRARLSGIADNRHREWSSWEFVDEEATKELRDFCDGGFFEVLRQYGVPVPAKEEGYRLVVLAVDPWDAPADRDADPEWLARLDENTAEWVRRFQAPPWALTTGPMRSSDDTKFMQVTAPVAQRVPYDQFDRDELLQRRRICGVSGVPDPASSA